MSANLLFGWIDYRLLPVSDLPNVDFPTIVVSVSLPGASPETMSTAVAMPLERRFSTIAGVDSMTSTNMLGSTTITLQFTLDRNIDAAAQDAQSMISKAGRDLPPTCRRRPHIGFDASSIRSGSRWSRSKRRRRLWLARRGTEPPAHAAPAADNVGVLGDVCCK
jgi:multidrug efflux pump subunit AcrB